MECNIRLFHWNFAVEFGFGFVHSYAVVASLAIFVFEFLAFVAWFVFLVGEHDSIRSGLRWLGRPCGAQFWGHNANSTFLIW